MRSAGGVRSGRQQVGRDQRSSSAVTASAGQEVIAVGDDMNDIQMLRHSGLGVAMGNARPSLKGIADRVIGTNLEDGLAEFVEELVAGRTRRPLRQGGRDADHQRMRRDRQTNAWLIADETAKQAVLFDAPNDTVRPLLDECQKRGWELIGLWLTHGHFDHLADHAVVSERFPQARLLVHREDEDKLTGEYPELFPLPFQIPTRQPDAYIEDGETLSIGSIEVQVLHTPGHAAGHVVFYMPRQGVLVSGDMIIGGSIGRTDLPDSDLDVMRQSLQRIASLPAETTLLPGHGEATTLKEELQSNRIFKALLQER